MKFIKVFLYAVQRDKSYLIAGLITICSIYILLSSHNWNKRDNLDKAILPNSLPNFTQYQTISDQKLAFFEYLRPFIRQENDKITHDRVYFEKLTQEYTQNSYHNTATLRKLKRLARRYFLNATDVKSIIKGLQVRIETIPESLILAQAAKESNWGTSPFAKHTNNLFGHWCNTEGCFLGSVGRKDSSRNVIERFESAQASVITHMKNINGNTAYKQLRQTRKQMIEQRQSVTGSKLAQGLQSFSINREDYIKAITDMIKEHQLE